MPIFEYECLYGHRTEFLDRYGERAPQRVCAVCGRIAERVVSSSNWQIAEKRRGSEIGEAIKRVKARGL